MYIASKKSPLFYEDADREWQVSILHTTNVLKRRRVEPGPMADVWGRTPIESPKRPRLIRAFLHMKMVGSIGEIGFAVSGIQVFYSQ
ncbi:MAG: hypothetical protein CMJ51_05840 [Planctomycetaceae bacterium]|nr:hypothetical protein [Planctomycetaceae bacterium]